MKVPGLGLIGWPRSHDHAGLITVIKHSILACPGLGERCVLRTSWLETEKDSFPKDTRGQDSGWQEHSWAPLGDPRHGRTLPSSWPGEMHWPPLQHLPAPGRDPPSSPSRLFWSKHAMRDSQRIQSIAYFQEKADGPNDAVYPLILLHCTVWALSEFQSLEHSAHSTLRTNGCVLFLSFPLGS